MLDKKGLFDGTGIFVFSDPGGAMPVLAIAEKEKKNLKKFKIISDRNYSFYKDFNLNIENFGFNTKEIISNFRPDFILTGTSYTSKMELEFVKVGNDMKVQTISYVDHITLIKERFNLFNSLCRPRVILVPDIGVKEAVEREFEDFKEIYLLRNPYLKFLADWKPKVSKNIFFKRHRIKLKNSSKIILLAPDPVSNLKEQNNFGFDEGKALNEISEIIDKHEHENIYILKPHPNQNLKIFKKNISSKIQLTSSEIDLKSLIYFSDIIIGFFSNLLIEATAFKKQVIRFHSSGFKNDPFLGRNIGEIANKKTLNEFLKTAAK